MEKAIDANIDGVVLDALVTGAATGRGNFEVSIKLLDLLFWVFTKKSVLEKCLWIFYKMIYNGLLPDVENCNRILKLLRDRGMMNGTKEFYSVMVVCGVRPTIVTYNTMLDSF
jgi:hypothetical protein